LKDLPLSAASPQARDAYVEDPRFALAHAAEARSLFLIAKVAEAIAAALMARELAKNLPQREKNNVEVAILPIEGGAAKAYALARDHLKLYPRDAMVTSTGKFWKVKLREMFR